MESVGPIWENHEEGAGGPGPLHPMIGRVGGGVRLNNNELGHCVVQRYDYKGGYCNLESGMGSKQFHYFFVVLD